MFSALYIYIYIYIYIVIHICLHISTERLPRAQFIWRAIFYASGNHYLCVCVCVCVCEHVVALTAWIFLTLSLSLSLSLSLVLTVHHSRHLFQVTASVHTKLMLISTCWSINPGTSMCKGSIEECHMSSSLLLQQSCMSSSSNLHAFWDERSDIYCFVRCRFQDFFEIACSILV